MSNALIRDGNHIAEGVLCRNGSYEEGEGYKSNSGGEIHPENQRSDY
jgi:hypothetical protein